MPILSLATKVLLIALLLNLLLLSIAWPAPVYSIVTPIWTWLGYRPGISAGLRRLSNWAARRGDQATAISLLTEAVTRSLERPSNSTSLDIYAMANKMLANARLTEALSWYELADNITPRQYRWKPKILAYYARCLTELGRYAEADAVLNRARQLYEPSPAWEGFGMDYIRYLRNNEKHLRLVLDARAYNAMLDGRFGDALKDYEAAARLPGPEKKSEKLRRLNNLAAASVQLGKIEDAERYVRRAESLAAGKPWRGMDHLMTTRAEVRVTQQRFVEARSDLNQALRIRGPDSWILALLARIALEEGKPEEAMGFVDQIPVDPRDRVGRGRLAQVLEQLAATSRTDLIDDRRREQLHERAARLRLPQPIAHPGTADPVLAGALAALSGRRLKVPSILPTLALCAVGAICFYLGAVIMFVSDRFELLVAEWACIIVLYGGAKMLSRDPLERIETAAPAAIT